MQAHVRQDDAKEVMDATDSIRRLTHEMRKVNQKLAVIARSIRRQSELIAATTQRLQRVEDELRDDEEASDWWKHGES